MTEPSPSELLAGVADALEQSVLPDLERGPSRNQILAAIGIVRRCSGAVDRYGPLLHEGCGDLLATLRRVVAADPTLVSDVERGGLENTWRRADELLAVRYPNPSALADMQDELSERVAEVLLSAQGRESEQLPALRQLLERMATRETDLGLSPW